MAPPSTVLARDDKVISITDFLRANKGAQESSAGLGMKLWSRMLDSLLAHYRPTYFESIDAFVVLDPLPFTGKDYVLGDALEETRDFCSLIGGKSFSRKALEERVYDGSVVGISKASRSVDIARAAPMTIDQFRKVHAESRQHCINLTLPQFDERNQGMYFSKWILDFLDNLSLGSTKHDKRHEFYQHMKHMPLLLDTSIEIIEGYNHGYPRYSSVPDTKNSGKEGRMITQMDVISEPRLIVNVTSGKICFPNVSMPGFSYHVSGYDEISGVPTDCKANVYMVITSGIGSCGRGKNSVALYLSMPGEDEIRGVLENAEDNPLTSKGQQYSAMAHFWRPDHVMDTIDFRHKTTTEKTNFSVPIVLYRK
jgi:hypothetical protein